MVSSIGFRFSIRGGIVLGLFVFLGSNSTLGHDFGQMSPLEREESCNSQTTCTQCLETTKCVWCRERNVNNEEATTWKRCVTPNFASKRGSDWCSPKMIVGRLSDELSIEEPAPGTKTSLSPARIKLSLHKGDSKRFHVRYTHKEDYPLDLYFLMDLSVSMAPYRNDLSNLGQDLFEATTNLTSDLELGFGSFVDKVILPMGYKNDTWLKNTCSHSINGVSACERPYSFKNQMSVSVNITMFRDRVKEAPISASIDFPEGGLDAMMQIFVCTREIGWRDNARRVLVYASDATYHIAGDGKLAGLVEPNDEKCHLNATGFYDWAELTDYPSIGQISRVARSSDINVIFVVDPEVQRDYTELSEFFPGSHVDVLGKKSTGVVKILRDYYAALVKKVSMTENANHDYFDVKMRTRCLGRKKEERSECEGISKSQMIDFEINIEAIKCPEESKDWNQTFVIKGLGIPGEVLVEVNMICGCPCAQQNDETYEKNSKACNEQGNLVCGACECDDNFFEDDCRCKFSEKESANASSTESCTEEGSDEVCHGRGTCECGKCICIDSQFSGKHCEYDSRSCDHKGKTCGGHGRCVRNECSCDQGYSGENCECDLGTSNCRADDNSTELCSGHGDCECNRCHCNKNDFHYGDLCQKCPDCANDDCYMFVECLRCQATYINGTTLTSGRSCSKKCETTWDVILVHNEILSENQKRDRYQSCSFIEEDGCTRKFHFKSYAQGDDNRIVLGLSLHKSCPNPLIIIGAGIGAVLGTVIVGVLILVALKVLTAWYDTREYARFEENRLNVRWQTGINPIFISPTTTFNNPTFGG